MCYWYRPSVVYCFIMCMSVSVCVCVCVCACVGTHVCVVHLLLQGPPQLFIHVFTCSPDRWSYYGDYMYCQMQRYYADENDASPITEIKDFIRHVRSIEEAKAKGLFRAPFLAELELIWKLRGAKLQHLLELGMYTV